MPANLDGDFLLVQQDKIKDVESKLKGTYYTDTITLRNYQDPSKIFFSAKVFKDLFPGKAPDFDGNAPKPAPSPVTCQGSMKWVTAGVTFVNLSVVCGRSSGTCRKRVKHSERSSGAGVWRCICSRRFSWDSRQRGSTEIR